MKLTPLKTRVVYAALTRAGFVVLRQKGGHRIWRHADGRITCTAVSSGCVSRNVLTDVLRQTGLPREIFF